MKTNRYKLYVVTSNGLHKLSLGYSVLRKNDVKLKSEYYNLDEAVEVVNKVVGLNFPSQLVVMDMNKSEIIYLNRK